MTLHVQHALTCDGCGGSHNRQSGQPWPTLVAAENSAIRCGWRRHPTSGWHWCPSCQTCSDEHVLVEGSVTRVCARCGIAPIHEGTTQISFAGFNITFAVTRKGDMVIWRITNGAVTATYELTSQMAANLGRALQRKSEC